MKKEDYDKFAAENRQLAREWSELGEHTKAKEALQRALENEKSRDSWLYRVFGW